MDKIKDDERYEEVVAAGDTLLKQMTTVEEALYQTKNRSGQDPLNFPIRLNNKLAALLGVAEEENGLQLNNLKMFELS